MGSRRLESLSDCQRFGVKIQVRCGCGREALLEPDLLMADCMRHRRSVKLRAVYARLRCADCGARPEWASTY